MKAKIIQFCAKGTAQAVFFPRPQWQALVLVRAPTVLSIVVPARRTLVARWQRNPAGQMQCQWSVQVEQARSDNDESPPRGNAVSPACFKHGRRLGRYLFTHATSV